MTPSGLTILLAVEPIDMRRSFRGLALAVQEHLGKDPKAEKAMFAFVNARRDMMKILWRDATGWCLLSKKLDARTVPPMKDIAPGQKSMVVDARTLQVFLAGVESARRTRSMAMDARAAAEHVRDGLARENPQRSTRNRR